MPRQEGQFIAEDFFQNVGGLNTADSPFIVRPEMSGGGMNFDYTQRGAFRKRPGHTLLNSTPDTQLKTLGLAMYDNPTASRAVIRAAGTKIQHYDTNANTFTNLTEDTTAAGSDFLSGSSIIPVASSMFNTATENVLWLSGGGQTVIHGATSATKATANGVTAITGTMTATVATGSAGVFVTPGVYWYVLVLQKASTSNQSNASLDVSATVVNTTDSVTLHLGSITAVDTTKYNKILIYRSAVSGVQFFTEGDQIASLSITGGVPATYVDTGTSIDTAQNIPRSGNEILDNTPLPSGTYNTIVTWKNKLVTSNNSSLFISDVNKPESWPLVNYINVPSGGAITGLAVVTNLSPFSGTSDEFLCVFKQRELWILAGDSFQDWSLKYVDNSGSPGQNLIINANGYVFWIGYRGVFMWDGNVKPIYVSQPIEDQFQLGGKIDKSRLQEAFGIFAQSRNELQWYLSDQNAHQYVLRLDLRLTVQSQEADAMERKIMGVFTPDELIFPIYASLSCLLAANSTDEEVFLGDNTGHLYLGYSGQSEGGDPYTLQYITPFLDCSTPGKAKRFNKVVVWVLNNGVDNITLDFWTDYKYQVGMSSTITQPVSANFDSDGLIWDVGKWDVNQWDTSENQIKPLVFNLNSSAGNNTEGDCIRLQVSQTGSAETVVVYGFTVLYNEIGMRK